MASVYVIFEDWTWKWLYKKGIYCLFNKLKLDGIFISEFLIQVNLTLFHQVRVFADANKNKIKQVYTRNAFFYNDASTKEITIIYDANDPCKL